MNPTFPLSGAQMEDMLERHRAAGARFVAPYFLNGMPARFDRAVEGLRQMDISPDNTETKSGAATFYHAIQDIIQHQ
jgi:hypothetical protein